MPFAPALAATIATIGADPTGLGPPELQVDINARVIFVSRTTFHDGESDGTDFLLDSARLGLELHRRDWLEVVVEGDFAGRASVRDAYVRLEPLGKSSVALGRSVVGAQRLFIGVRGSK